jgi:hypothetical protein
MALKNADRFAGSGIQQAMREAVGKSIAGRTTRPSDRGLARLRLLIGCRRANHCTGIMANGKRRFLLIGYKTPQTVDGSQGVQRLFLIASQDLAGPGIDEVDPGAGEARH